MSEIWGLAVATVAGAVISSAGAKSAANKTNAANQSIADSTNQTNWNQYLLSRGVSTGELSGVPAGNVNTVLPIGFTINGAPAEQALMNRIFSVGNTGAKYDEPGYATSGTNINSFLAANPQVRTDLEKMLDPANGGDGRTVEQWLHDDAEAGDPNFLQQLTNHANASKQVAVQQQQSVTLPPQYQKLLDYGPQTLDQLYGGGFLAQQQAAQGGINDARLKLAGTVQQGIDEQRLKFGDLNAGQLSGLDRILSTNTAGSKGIYDASMLSADTYANAVKQATSDELQRQMAQRAIKGFTGEGSGDNLLRARTLAAGYQAAGGARAAAGVDQAKRLYDIGNTDATGRFNVNSDYLKALSTLLNSNGTAANASALLQNNTDNAAIINNDLSTRLGTMGQAGQLVTQKLGIDQQLAGAQYNDINALLQSLGFFKQNQPATPGTTAPTYQTPVNNGQIIGAGISAGASGLSNYYQNQSLINALKGVGSNSGGLNAYNNAPVGASYNLGG